MSELDVVALAHDVAAYLGDGWGVSTEDSRLVTVIGPDWERISVADERKAGMVTWFGHHQFGDHHSINVRADRPARAHAAEITRRLLPAYRATLMEARARAERVSENEGRRAAARTRLAATLPGGNAEADGTAVYFDQGTAHVVESGATVQFEFSAPLEVALRIAAVLRDASVLPITEVRTGMLLDDQRVLFASRPYRGPDGRHYVDVHLSTGDPDGDEVEEWTVPVADWLRVAVTGDEGD